MNKCGQFVLSKEALKMIFYGLLIIVVSFIIVAVFGVAVEKDVNVAELEQHVAVMRMLSSVDCLAYSDEGKVFPGNVDLDKFSESNLNECFSYKEREGQGVIVEFFDIGGTSFGKFEINNLVTAQLPVCGLKDTKYDCYFTRKYVLYEEGGLFKEGYLDFTVVTKLE